MSLSGLTAQLSKLNPLSKTPRGEDAEDQGEAIDPNAFTRPEESNLQPDDRLKISPALKAFLAKHKILSSEDASVNQPEMNTPALSHLLKEPHVKVSASVTDRSYPLADYFISSSHNTYLLAHQLYGTSSAEAYETALNTGARCVEIDAWDGDDNKDEPKVTHGYTLVSSIAFRQVCETIRDVVDAEKQATESKGTGTVGEGVLHQGAGPIMISLENHCSAHGQQRLVDIMKEVLGDRLLSQAVLDKGHQEQDSGTSQKIRLADLGNKVVVIVEYHLPDEKEDDSSDSSDGEDDKQAKAQYKADKKNAAKESGNGIIPSLAALGIYAQSIKPRDGSWYEKTSVPYQVEAGGDPHHPLMNLSESALSKIFAANHENKAKVTRHNSQHLMRVYPKGTRISSANLHPVPYWGVGAQICGLNMQTFGASVQMNHALFEGTEGYVLKPKFLRSDGQSTTKNPVRKERLQLHIAGAANIPLDDDHKSGEDLKPYVTCSLYHPSFPAEKAEKRKTKPYKQHKLTAALHHHDNPPATDPLFKETLEWYYDDHQGQEEVTFLRILLKSDDSFAKNPVLCVAAVRLSTLVMGQWRFVRMLNLRGRPTNCLLLMMAQVGKEEGWEMGWQ